MFGFYGIKCYGMQRLHMFSKQSGISLTHAVHTKCKNGCVFAKTKPQLILTTVLR